MTFLVTAHTDIGIKKSTNQDSVLALKATYKNEEIVFAVLCDGMGGLAKGEVASASVIDAFLKWFENDFPVMLEEGFDKEGVFRTWENICSQMNSKIAAYGVQSGISLGTTVVALLIYNGRYYILNIGDSRIYRYNTVTTVLTKDHTYVQREVEMGRMTPEEALNHPKRNVLLQCIGASPFIQPDFFEGEVKPGEVYLLCSDGFRHIITENEMFEQFNPQKLNDVSRIKQAAVYLTDLNKSRFETDNISVVVIKSE